MCDDTFLSLVKNYKSCLRLNIHAAYTYVPNSIKDIIGYRHTNTCSIHETLNFMKIVLAVLKCDQPPLYQH